ncbi:MAG: DUF1287 domain-containing protein [Acidobacteriales bacterium]|nr:DUF1287 domain-containing protein [Terriglobales bacterium]
MKRLIPLLLLTSGLLCAQSGPLRLVAAAKEQIAVRRGYDPRYIRIAYPGGDVPGSGVCTDVLIRAFRKLGLDLQKEVHEDMSDAFSAYPKLWGLRAPDPNIDHRRVPNLMTYFRRKGKQARISLYAIDYQPGDIVAWDLGGGVPHIGIVSDEKAPAADRHLIIHNIGGGVKSEDILFRFKITGHYRYD